LIDDYEGAQGYSYDKIQDQDEYKPPLDCDKVIGISTKCRANTGYKWKKVKSFFDNECSANSWTYKINFASAYWTNPPFVSYNVTDFSSKINPEIRKYLYAYNFKSIRCIIPMDFPDQETVNTIIKHSVQGF